MSGGYGRSNMNTPPIIVVDADAIVAQHFLMTRITI